jgi:hypothetical protein
VKYHVVELGYDEVRSAWPVPPGTWPGFDVSASRAAGWMDQGDPKDGRLLKHFECAGDACGWCSGQAYRELMKGLIK